MKAELSALAGCWRDVPTSLYAVTEDWESVLVSGAYGESTVTIILVTENYLRERLQESIFFMKEYGL